LRRAGLLMRQTWDLWTGGTTASSTALLAWDAAKTGDRLKRWYPPSTDFSAFLNPYLVKWRARDADRNNAWARRAINLLVDYVIGTGLKPMVSLPDLALRGRVNRMWNAWCDTADWIGRNSFYGLQAAAFRACLVDGEVIAVVRPGPTLQIQLLASEFLARERDNGVDIGGDIQYNEGGQRLGYWLYKKVPSQALNPVSEFVSADRVIHLFWPEQPGFERGVSWLAPALVPLYELQTFMEASLVRARTGSLFAGFIRSADGTPFLTNAEGEATFEPGSMARLRPGDEIQFSTPPDPTQGYQPFIGTQLRAIGSALGLPYELLSGDLSNVTFASGRHSLLAFQKTTDALVQMIAFQFCRPVWDWWVRIQVASGTLPEEVLTAPVRWIAPEFPTLDARMSTNSTLQKIRAGLMSRSEAVSGTGADPEGVDEQIAADNARADRLGLVLDSDPRRTTLQGQEQTSATVQ
jgi:lambda family phage portal protein